jgi:hypothetical protein
VQIRVQTNATTKPFWPPSPSRQGVHKTQQTPEGTRLPKGSIHTAALFWRTHADSRDGAGSNLVEAIGNGRQGRKSYGRSLLPEARRPHRGTQSTNAKQAGAADNSLSLY